MPKSERGCYEKMGYPREFIFRGEMYVYKVSGCTRMVYANQQNPHIIAKVMPARASALWKPTWTQNATEAACLERMEKVSFSPNVHYHDEAFPFVNLWHEADVMDVLVVDRLGIDLQQAATDISFSDYVEAYCAALWAIAKMTDLGMIVPDPHPYNCSLLLDNTKLALPCDFGEATDASTPVVRKALKSFFAGFKHMASTVYGANIGQDWEDLPYHISHATHPLSVDWVMHGCSFFKRILAANARSSPFEEVRQPEPQPQHAQAPPLHQTPPPPHSEVKAGTFVLIHSLQNQCALNGSVAFVISQGERYRVKLENQEIKSVRQAKLTLTMHPSGAWICKGCKLDVYWKSCPDAGWTGRKGKWRCGKCSEPRPSDES